MARIDDTDVDVVIDGNEECLQPHSLPTVSSHPCQDSDPLITLVTVSPVIDSCDNYFLNERQAMAYSIIVNHLEQHL